MDFSINDALYFLVSIPKYMRSIKGKSIICHFRSIFLYFNIQNKIVILNFGLFTISYSSLFTRILGQGKKKSWRIHKINQNSRFKITSHSFKLLCLELQWCIQLFDSIYLHGLLSGIPLSIHQNLDYSSNMWERGDVSNRGIPESRPWR